MRWVLVPALVMAIYWLLVSLTVYILILSPFFFWGFVLGEVIAFWLVFRQRYQAHPIYDERQVKRR